MEPLITCCGETLSKHIGKAVQNKEMFEIKEYV